MSSEDIMVFSGSGSPRLTAKICDYLMTHVRKGETIRFSEGNIFVRILENVRGRHVYIVQSTVFPANDNFMELLFWIDAFKRASAENVTVIIPYFSYGKGDKKDEPRVSIRARVCADAIEAAGADRVVTMDLHAPQIQGFFRIPVDNLYAMPVLIAALKKEKLDNCVIVSPDSGYAKMARQYSAHCCNEVVIADKVRTAHDEKAEVMNIIGDVEGRVAVIVDDFTISGRTLTGVAEKLVEKRAKKVYAMVAHAALAKGSVERIDGSPIESLFITDTVENQPVTLSRKIKVISVAPLFGEAIRRIHFRESISAMFES